MSDQAITTVVDGIGAISVIVAGVVLLALGKVDGTAGLALIGVGVTMLGGTAKTFLALRVPAPSQTVGQVPPAATTTTTTTG